MGWPRRAQRLLCGLRLGRWSAPIEWSGGDVSLGLGAVPARARAERLGRIAEPDARA